jgi:toxin HigB-1
MESGSRGMEVEFEDERLALVETPRASETRLPVAVIQSARKKLNVIRAAPDERTLRNWKSLHFEKLLGSLDARSIRLNSQWRMVFRLNTQSVPPTVHVISIEDYH